MKRLTIILGVGLLMLSLSSCHTTRYSSRGEASSWNSDGGYVKSMYIFIRSTRVDEEYLEVFQEVLQDTLRSRGIDAVVELEDRLELAMRTQQIRRLNETDMDVLAIVDIKNLTINQSCSYNMEFYKELGKGDPYYSFVFSIPFTWGYDNPPSHLRKMSPQALIVNTFIHDGLIEPNSDN